MTNGWKPLPTITVVVLCLALGPATWADEAPRTLTSRAQESIDRASSVVERNASPRADDPQDAWILRAEASLERARVLLTAGAVDAAAREARLARAEASIYHATTKLDAWTSSSSPEDPGPRIEAETALKRALNRLDSGNYDAAAQHAADAERIVGRESR